MDQDDFRALIDELARQLRDIGAADVADEDNYRVQDESTGEERLLEPRERLIAMLHAFDRYLAVRDGSTFRDGMDRLSHFSREPPNRAVFFPVADDTVARRERDLSDVPDLSAVRENLRSLIEQLLSDPGTSSGGAH